MFRSQLYSSIFENPLLMTNIVSHLDAKDAVHLMMSQGAFTKDARFQDTMKMFLDTKKEEYDNVKAELCLLNRRMQFGSTLAHKLCHLDNISGIENRKRHVVDIFDFCVENKDVLDIPDMATLKRIIHNKLVSFLRNDTSYFSEDAVYYLAELFDIQVQAQAVPNTDDEYVEYIIDLNGERIWI